MGLRHSVGFYLYFRYIDMYIYVYAATQLYVSQKRFRSLDKYIYVYADIDIHVYVSQHVYQHTHRYTCLLRYIDMYIYVLPIYLFFAIHRHVDP